MQWSQRADFSGAVTVNDLPWSVYTRNKPLAAGSYFWRYRVIPPTGAPSAWSHARRFTVPGNAVEFPQPAMAELRERIPKDHLRLFVTSKDLPRLCEWAKGGGGNAYKKLLQRADQLLKAKPAPEPKHMGTASDLKMAQYWWPNRAQTMKACQEAEVLAFAYVLTNEQR